MNQREIAQKVSASRSTVSRVVRRYEDQKPLAEEDERELLWKSMFPPQVPLAPDIDWDLIAKRFEMAGGYIKKAALRAALIAAEARRPLTTSDLLEAARLEYREMGRII